MQNTSDKMSPRPWVARRGTGRGGTLTGWEVLDEHGDLIAYFIADDKAGQEKAHRIVHAVNSHDELVEGLCELLMSVEAQGPREAYREQLRVARGKARDLIGKVGAL